jgi:outer membrane receptor protein involved in Fe transport
MDMVTVNFTLSRLTFLGAGLALCTLPALGTGQQTGCGTDGVRVRGRVTSDSASVPLAGASVIAIDAVPPARVVAATDGRFALCARVESRVVGLRIGFRPETLSVGDGIAPLTIRLHETGLQLTPEIVLAQPSLTAASSSVIRQLDIALRPRESSQELLRSVPGLVIAQHAGGGKAEQIFLRGFDADHGTDVALSVDGTPVNMVSHAHGQGYADLHYLMPEVVDKVDVRKGPFDARDGDLSTAGAVAFTTKDRVDAPTFSVRGGTFDTQHAIGLLPFGGDADHAGGYFAGALHYSDGPFLRKQDYGRFNIFSKFTAPLASNVEFVTSASAFGGRWHASGEIPTRAVASGLVNRFGTIDPVEGGNTARADISAALRSRGGEQSEWEARVYATRYGFQLFSDFTFFLTDSVHGDAIEQRDERVVTGASASYGHRGSWLNRATSWKVGLVERNDRADTWLFHQEQRVRLDARSAANVLETSGGAWTQFDIQLTDRLRADAGLRADVYRFDVRDRLASGSDLGVPAAEDASHSSGRRVDAIVSPKLNVAYDITNNTSLFFNAGSGFHSNDARDVVTAPRGETILPRATSAEVGARRTWNGGTVAASVWGLSLQSELVWAGDAGTTESSGRTRRVGVDLEGRTRVLPWLWADADVNLARGRFLDEPSSANRIPLAPTVTWTGGLTMRDLGPVQGGVRARFVGARPAIEDNSVRAQRYMVAELFAGYQRRDVRFFVTVDNALNARWNEAQFATTSRLRGESQPVTELNFTPGAPRAIQVGIERRF